MGRAVPFTAALRRSFDLGKRKPEATASTTAHDGRNTGSRKPPKATSNRRLSGLTPLYPQNPRADPAPIPKGLYPPAQGCEPRATLGKTPGNGQPQWGCGHRPDARCRNPVGVDAQFRSSPRVARRSQPWALGRNPFGIQREKSAFGRRNGHAGRGGLPHQGDLRRGPGVALVDEAAESALQGHGFGGEGAGGGDGAGYPLRNA